MYGGRGLKLMDRPLQPISAIRRLPLRLCLLLPLLLALSQHAAWLHELGHVAYAATTHQIAAGPGTRSIENGVCPSCQSFGQLGSALASSPATLAASCSQLSHQAAAQYAQPSAQQPAPRNRGPPHLA
jgi:hypothetical protein